MTTVLTPKSDQPEILSYYIEKASGGNLLQERMSQGELNPVMYGILKMVEYKVQIITFSQIFHDFYTYLPGQLCKIPKTFNGRRYRCGIYCAFEDNHLVAKSHRSSEALFFTFSDSLPAVKSNTVFGKITLMALPFKSKKIWFTSVSAWRNEQQQQHPCLNQKRSKALGINIMKKAF